MKKIKKKSNKKVLLPLLTIMLIGSVFAIGYYALFSVTFNVSPSIVLGGELTQSLGVVYSGEVIRGTPITITNDAPSERTITITEDSGSNIQVSYLSDLIVAQKNVNFSADVWTILDGGNNSVVEYTLVGDSFTAEVVEGALDDYVLVYYKDNSDRFNSPATAIGIDSIVGNLAYENDKNNDEYDYCETREYVTCHGAKIWYLPSEVVDGEGNVNWGMAGEVLFETKLIQYNAEGEIVIYPGQTLSVIPVYTIGTYVSSGEYTITTTVA